MFAAERHDAERPMQIIIIDGQLCPWKDISSPAPRREKKKKHWGRLHS